MDTEFRGRVIDFSVPIEPIEDLRIPLTIAMECEAVIATINTNINLDSISRSLTIWPCERWSDQDQYWEALKPIRDYWDQLYLPGKVVRELVIRSCIHGDCNIMLQIIKLLGVEVGRHVEYKEFRCVNGCDPTTTGPSLANIRGWKNAMQHQFREPNIIIGGLELCELAKNLRPGGCIVLKIAGILSVIDVGKICQLKDMFLKSQLIVTSTDNMFFIGINAISSVKLRTIIHRNPLPKTLSLVNSILSDSANDRIQYYINRCMDAGVDTDHSNTSQWAEYFKVHR